jgi:hypothetical protein
MGFHQGDTLATGSCVMIFLVMLFAFVGMKVSRKDEAPEELPDQWESVLAHPGLLAGVALAKYR